MIPTLLAEPPNRRSAFTPRRAAPQRTSTTEVLVSAPRSRGGNVISELSGSNWKWLVEVANEPILNKEWIVYDSVTASLTGSQSYLGG